MEKTKIIQHLQNNLKPKPHYGNDVYTWQQIINAINKITPKTK